MTNGANSIPVIPSVDNAAWKGVVLKYQKSSTWRAVWQIVNTLVPYALLLVSDVSVSLSVSWWLLPPLAVLAGALLVRVFIIFHDCGHGSFFKSRAANDAVGFIAGVLTFTPYYHWRWEHAIHHGSCGRSGQARHGRRLDLTVQEYLESSRWKKFAYRLARNPVVLFVIAPLFLFVVRQRFPSPKASRAGTAFGLLDESGHPGHGRRLELGFRPQGVSADPIDHAGGGRRRGRVDVLCPASIRRRLLGTRGQLEITSRRPCKAVRFTSCRGSCNGSPATSAFITSII